MGARFHSNNFKQWRLNDDKWQDSVQCLITIRFIINLRMLNDHAFLKMNKK